MYRYVVINRIIYFYHLYFIEIIEMSGRSNDETASLFFLFLLTLI